VRMAAADGITHQVATPHANDRYHYDRPYLQGVVAHLQQLWQCADAKPGLRFHLSYDNLQDVLANPERYAIEGTHYMLVELSNYSVPQQTTDCFMQLGDRGITAVITHPERNPILRESPQRVVEWAEQGCVIQMTGSALTDFGGNGCGAPRSGCWNVMRCMCWQRMHTIPRSGFRCSRQLVRLLPKSAARKLPMRSCRPILRPYSIAAFALFSEAGYGGYRKSSGN